MSLISKKKTKSTKSDWEIIDRCNFIVFMMLLPTMLCGVIFFGGLCGLPFILDKFNFLILWILSGMGLLICVLIYKWNSKIAKKHGGVHPTRDTLDI